MQLARYLIDEDLARAEDFEFDTRGRLASFGKGQELVPAAVASGMPFMTSGCPDETGMTACNRPYGDCAPGDDIRSFPFKPDEEDLELIRTQLKEYQKI